MLLRTHLLGDFAVFLLALLGIPRATSFEKKKEKENALNLQI